MNFDINTLSTLMKMMGSMKPAQSDERSRDTREYAQDDRQNTSENVSVFAMQNGIGQKVEFGSAPKKTETKRSANPMQSMLEMMTGGSSSENSGDMMSSLLPMLMNMMSGRNQATAAGFKNQTPPEANKPKAESANNQSLNSDREKNETDEKNINNKTQPIRKDKFEPIAFAGYTLISALNKLYIAKRI